ncbi:MAG TPA: MBL fold metallo-hydrolase [Chloroflexota bacterium]|nr:MBL fold metallo-hydrolase [Chloroflexota bacterium]
MMLRRARPGPVQLALPLDLPRTSRGPAAGQGPEELAGAPADPWVGLPFRYDRGVHLHGADMWLDPHARRPIAYVSHGHSDHCLPHGHALATPATAAFYRLRTRRTSVTELPFHQPHRVKDWTFELFPAGHILGASQVMMVGPDGERLVYTGDFKLRPAPCQEPAEVRPCDVLVMECTFGHPHYRFPPLEEVQRQLRSFVERCFAQDVIPVVCGYILGKGQEALCLLTRAGYRVAVHESIYRVAQVYQEQGVDLGEYELLNLASAPALRGTVVLCPPHLKKTVTPPLGPFRTVMLSGWAVDPRARYRYGMDEMIGLSDHADFGELLEYVQRARPRKVYTVHGDAAFAGYLRQRGFDAQHLLT